MKTPWESCHVYFKIRDREKVRRVDDWEFRLPHGWSYLTTTADENGVLVGFQVDIPPTERDGKHVIEELDDIQC